MEEMTINDNSMLKTELIISNRGRIWFEFMHGWYFKFWVYFHTFLSFIVKAILRPILWHSKRISWKQYRFNERNNVLKFLIFWLKSKQMERYKKKLSELSLSIVTFSIEIVLLLSEECYTSNLVDLSHTCTSL